MIYLKTGVGIELRKDDILLAAVQSNFTKAAFTRFLRITDYPRFTHADLRGAIDRFFRDNGLGRESVILGVSRSDCVIRQLDLPLEAKENLKEVIRYQVQAFEPTEEDGFYYDYVLLEGAPGQKRLTVLLAMVRKSFLDKQLALLREIGIRPLFVACGSAGLANMYLAAQKDAVNKTFFLVDAGKSELELFALRNRQLVYSREVPKNDAQSWGDLLFGEINEAAGRLRLGNDSVLEKIVLTGESSKDVYEEIRERIPECELLEKSFPLTPAGINGQLIQEAAAVCGLAFTAIAPRPSVRLNLLPPDLQRRQGRWGIAVAAALGVVILLLLTGLGLIKPIQNSRQLASLEEETKKFEDPVRRVRSLEAEGEKLETQRKLMADLLEDDDRNLDILKYLTETFPTDTFLRSYSNNNGVITMNGESGSASDLISQLDKSPLLKDVTQRGSISRNPATGREVFNLEVKLR
jgi:general secretion pathway protein L